MAATANGAAAAVAARRRRWWWPRGPPGMLHRWLGCPLASGIVLPFGEAMRRPASLVVRLPPPPAVSSSSDGHQATLWSLCRIPQVEMVAGHPPQWRPCTFDARRIHGHVRLLAPTSPAPDFLAWLDHGFIHNHGPVIVDSKWTRHNSWHNTNLNEGER